MSSQTTTDRPQAGHVRHAGPADVPALVEVLSAAFADDPVFTWLVPDPARRRVVTPAIFLIAVQDNLPHGEVYAAEPEPAAAAVWVPPGLESDPHAEAALIERYLVAAGEAAERLETAMGLMAEAHPQEPHAYLFLLATRPERQSEGLGSALLRYVLDRCDREQTPAYLEATSDDNRRLYERHGFKVTGKICLPDGPPLWLMWRSPR